MKKKGLFHFFFKPKYQCCEDISGHINYTSQKDDIIPPINVFFFICVVDAND